MNRGGPWSHPKMGWANLCTPRISAGSYWETSETPLRETLCQPPSLKASSSEDLDGLGSQDAVASPAIGHYFPIARQIPQSMPESC